MPGISAAAFLRAFERSGFMVDVTWTPPAGGAAVAFKGLMRQTGDAPFAGLVMASEPMLVFETAYCPELTNDDLVSIGGTEYRVRQGGFFRDASARQFELRKAAG